MFFLLYFGLSNVWHVSSVPFFFFSFSLQTGFSFLALCSVSCRRLKRLLLHPRKKGEHTEKEKKKQSFPTFPPFCVALRPPHTASAASSKREKERERVMKSQSDCFFSFSLSFSPLPMEEAFKREEKGRGDRGRKEEKEAL